MTKKMFQVTRAGMVAVTIFICLNLLLDKKVMVGDGHIWERCAWLLISLVAFLAVSVLYEKKRKIFSVGYLFLLINVFIDGVLCPGYFTDSRLREMEREGVQEPQDFFLLYLGVYFIIMAVIFLYLLCVKQTTDEVKQSDFIRYKRADDITVFLMGIVILFLNFRLGTAGLVLYVPVFCYFAARFLCTHGNLNLYTVGGLLGGLYCLYQVRTNRFLFIQYIMPLLLIFFLFAAVNDNYKKGNIGNYAIYYKHDNKVIGNIGLNNIDPNSKSSEIGICINPKYWGHNFATELTVITLITGFELLNLDKLIALTYAKNKYTPKSLENLGFKYINTFKTKASGNTCHRFELTKDEYLKLKEYYLPNLIESFYI
jgi:RimJ/RimL family protein N-acetyltransferase